jgi:hypothetical protein
MRASRAQVFAGVLFMAQAYLVSATHDLDFVAEHLPEVAMDNRFLTLPLDSASVLRDGSWGWGVQAGFAEIRSGSLSVGGPSAALIARYRLGSRWSLIGLGFLDTAAFSGSSAIRPLAPRFSDAIPLHLPADALLSGFSGRLRHFGTGMAASLRPQHAAYALTFGLLYDRIELRDLRARYLLLTGASAGEAGVVDYSANYPFWVPFGAISWSIRRGEWLFTPRFTAGMPLPRWGWRGRLEGPGFAVAGDTDDIGNGVHMGDAFAGFGLGVGYVPWHVSLDLGTLADQALAEPLLHKGIDRVWLLSVTWDLFDADRD